MTLYLVNEWKKRLGGAQDPSAFLLGLESTRFSTREKEIIIEALDDWDVIMPTWFEIADYLPTIERLYEDKNFPQRFRAAQVASKVSYCLGDDRGALQLALASAVLFKLTPRPASKVVGNQDEQAPSSNKLSQSEFIASKGENVCDSHGKLPIDKFVNHREIVAPPELDDNDGISQSPRPQNAP